MHEYRGNDPYSAQCFVPGVDAIDITVILLLMLSLVTLSFYTVMLLFCNPLVFIWRYFETMQMSYLSS